MALRQTIWQPDTCECMVTYQWDDTVAEDQRVHTPLNTIKCPAHTSLTTHTQVFNVLTEENPRKNQILQEILDNAPNTNWYDIDTGSGGTRVLKQNINFRWVWSGTAPNRIITVFFDGITLTTTQRNNLQTRLDNRFGVGKATIG